MALFGCLLNLLASPNNTPFVRRASPVPAPASAPTCVNAVNPRKTKTKMCPLPVSGRKSLMRVCYLDPWIRCGAPFATFSLVKVQVPLFDNSALALSGVSVAPPCIWMWCVNESKGPQSPEFPCSPLSHVHPQTIAKPDEVVIEIVRFSRSIRLFGPPLSSVSFVPWYPFCCPFVMNAQFCWPRLLLLALSVLTWLIGYDARDFSFVVLWHPWCSLIPPPKICSKTRKKKWTSLRVPVPIFDPLVICYCARLAEIWLLPSLLRDC